MALRLREGHWHIGDPIRAITVGVSKLVPGSEAAEQLDLFDLMGAPEESGKLREKQDKVEAAMDALRQKMGNTAVTLGVQKNEEIGVRREWKDRRQEGRTDE